MDKTTKRLLILSLTLVFLMTLSSIKVANARLVIPELWKRVNNAYLIPKDATLNLGDSTARIPNIYATNLDTNTITINTATSGTLTIDVNTDISSLVIDSEATTATGVSWDFQNTSGDLLNIGVNSVEKFAIDYTGGAYFAGNVGIGTTVPATLLTIANNNWISSIDNAGSGSVNMFKVNTSDEIDVGGTLNIGPIDLAEDSGAVTLVNLPVSATPAANTEESYVFAIDSNAVLKVYGKADSSGGTNTHSITINGPVYMLEQADAYADTAAYGQIWVNTATPNELYFTTDAGNDREIAYAGGAFHDGFSDFVANEHIDWTSASVAFSTSGSVGTGTITATGPITSSYAGSLGWSVIANTTPGTTSCTGSCTGACVMGFDEASAAETIVDCASTASEKCLCANSS